MSEIEDLDRTAMLPEESFVRRKIRKFEKSHCVNGHPFTAENSSFRKVGNRTFRVCKQCHRERQIAFKGKKAAQGLSNWGQRAIRKEMKERAELARLKAKYE